MHPKRDPMTQKQIDEARKMPGYPMFDTHGDPDNVSGNARQMPDSHPGAPSKLPGYSRRSGM